MEDLKMHKVKHSKIILVTTSKSYDAFVKCKEKIVDYENRGYELVSINILRGTCIYLHFKEAQKIYFILTNKTYNILPLYWRIFIIVNTTRFPRPNIEVC